MTRYAAPGTEGSLMSYEARYDHWIGGAYVAPARGRYFENPSPVDGRPFTEVARGTEEDVERALDAAHAAAPAWGRTAPAERAAILLRIADRMENNLEALAVAETWDNGKPVRETLAADIPLAIDHFRYFAGALRAQEGTLSEIDDDTVAYHFHEPLGVVAQIIPWNFPILMAVWKLAPALAAGNAVILKPAEQTPASVHFWLGLVADLLPPGVLNVVNGFGEEAGKPLASSPRVAKIAFTGETTTGRLIMGYATENLKPVTLELGGSRRTSSSTTCGRRTTTSATRPSRASRCSPSTRARSAPAPRAHSSSGATTASSWKRRSPARSGSSRDTPWTRPR